MFGSRCSIFTLLALLVAFLLSGCAAYYGGADVTATEVRSVGALERGSIETLAVAPVLIPDTEGDVGHSESLTMAAYNQLRRAAETETMMRFDILTPLQLNATLDLRMTSEEREASLLEAARRGGASHILVLEAAEPEGGEFTFAHGMGLARRQGTVPASVKVLESNTGHTLWMEDFNVTVKFSAVGSATVKTEVREKVVEMGVDRFVRSYGP